MTTEQEEVLSGEFVIPIDHPCLQGHFPGHPIVPAVVLIDLSCAALLSQSPRLGMLREIRTAKFVGPVQPGETVRVMFRPAGERRYRFECSTGTGLVAQGILCFNAP